MVFDGCRKLLRKFDILANQITMGLIESSHSKSPGGSGWGPHKSRSTPQFGGGYEARPRQAVTLPARTTPIMSPEVTSPHDGGGKRSLGASRTPRSSERFSSRRRDGSLQRERRDHNGGRSPLVPLPGTLIDRRKRRSDPLLDGERCIPPNAVTQQDYQAPPPAAPPTPSTPPSSPIYSAQTSPRSGCRKRPTAVYITDDHVQFVESQFSLTETTTKTRTSKSRVHPVNVNPNIQTSEIGTDPTMHISTYHMDPLKSPNEFKKPTRRKKAGKKSRHEKPGKTEGVEVEGDPYVCLHYGSTLSKESGNSREATTHLHDVVAWRSDTDQHKENYENYAAPLSPRSQKRSQIFIQVDNMSSRKIDNQDCVNGNTESVQVQSNVWFESNVNREGKIHNSQDLSRQVVNGIEVDRQSPYFDTHEDSSNSLHCSSVCNIIEYSESNHIFYNEDKIMPIQTKHSKKSATDKHIKRNKSPKGVTTENLTALEYKPTKSSRNKSDRQQLVTKEMIPSTSVSHYQTDLNPSNENACGFNRLGNKHTNDCQEKYSICEQNNDNYKVRYDFVPGIFNENEKIRESLDHSNIYPDQNYYTYDSVQSHNDSKEFLVRDSSFSVSLSYYDDDDNQTLKNRNGLPYGNFGSDKYYCDKDDKNIAYELPVKEDYSILCDGDKLCDDRYYALNSDDYQNIAALTCDSDLVQKDKRDQRVPNESEGCSSTYGENECQGVIQQSSCSPVCQNKCLNNTTSLPNRRHTESYCNSEFNHDFEESMEKFRAFRKRFRSLDIGSFPILRLPLEKDQPRLIDILKNPNNPTVNEKSGDSLVLRNGAEVENTNEPEKDFGSDIRNQEKINSELSLSEIIDLTQQVREYENNITHHKDTIDHIVNSTENDKSAEIQTSENLVNIEEILNLNDKSLSNSIQFIDEPVFISPNNIDIDSVFELDDVKTLKANAKEPKGYRSNSVKLKKSNVYRPLRRTFSSDNYRCPSISNGSYFDKESNSSQNFWSSNFGKNDQKCIDLSKNTPKGKINFNSFFGGLQIKIIKKIYSYVTLPYGSHLITFIWFVYKFLT